jgi:hypothetical protein
VGSAYSPAAWLVPLRPVSSLQKSESCLSRLSRSSARLPLCDLCKRVPQCKPESRKKRAMRTEMTDCAAAAIHLAYNLSHGLPEPASMLFSLFCLSPTSAERLVQECRCSPKVVVAAASGILRWGQGSKDLTRPLLRRLISVAKDEALTPRFTELGNVVWIDTAHLLVSLCETDASSAEVLATAGVSQKLLRDTSRAAADVHRLRFYDSRPPRIRGRLCRWFAPIPLATELA